MTLITTSLTSGHAKCLVTFSSSGPRTPSVLGNREEPWGRDCVWLVDFIYRVNTGLEKHRNQYRICIDREQSGPWAPDCYILQSLHIPYIVILSLFGRHRQRNGYGRPASCPIFNQWNRIVISDILTNFVFFSMVNAIVAVPFQLLKMQPVTFKKWLAYCYCFIWWHEF